MAIQKITPPRNLGDLAHSLPIAMVVLCLPSLNHAAPLVRPADCLPLTSTDLACSAGLHSVYALPFAADENGAINVHNLTINGRYAYVANGLGGLQIVDLINPIAPKIISHLDTEGYVWAVAVKGRHAYLAYGADGLLILNIANPATPIIIATLNTGDTAKDLTIRGDYAYIANGESGLYIANISNPAMPILAAAIATLDARNSAAVDAPNAIGIAVSGDYAYLADSNGGLRVVNIADPNAPDLGGWYPIPGTTTSGVVISDNGRHATIASADGIRVVDIAANPGGDPAAVVSVINTAGTARSITLAGDYAFVADGDNSMLVMKIAGPASRPTITPIGRTGAAGDARDIGIRGDYAYISDNGFGLRVADISNPFVPAPLELVASLPLTQLLPPVAINGRGEHLFITYGTAGIRSFDITDPIAPVAINNIDSPIGGNMRRLDFNSDGDYAYVANGGVAVVEIRDSGGIILKKTIKTTGNAVSVQVAGGHAYVADGAAGLVVMALSDPVTPRITDPDGYAGNLGAAGDVAVSGDYAYLITNHRTAIRGLQVVDISDPADLSHVASLTNLNAPANITISGDYAYIGSRGGVQAVNIAAPVRAPIPANSDFLKLESTYAPSNLNAADLTLAGDYLFAAAGLQGVHMLDISTPGALTPMAQLAGIGNILHTYFKAPYLYAVNNNLLGFTAGNLQVINTTTAPALFATIDDYYNGDDDGDQRANNVDNCRFVMNNDQANNYSENGSGACLISTATPESTRACPIDPQGDACDDSDGDGIFDKDRAPLISASGFCFPIMGGNGAAVVCL